MQTKSRIQQLLASENIHPKKLLGQHFLIDLNLMRKLVDTAQIQKDDIILEAGCGTGSLTEELAKYAPFVLAVEIDNTLAKIAKQKLGQYRSAEIINADVLKNKNTINPTITDKIKSAQKKYPGRFLLISNLPYNIASPLMLNLVIGPLVADAMYVTIQKEVADRMTAKADSKAYGSLSILLAATGDIKKIRILKPSVFWPEPQVDSAMVGFVRKKEKTDKIKDVEMLNKLVKLFMQHRRKTLQTCTKLAAGQLKDIKNWPEIFNACSINPQNRPQQILPQKYVDIANLCCKLIQ